MMSSKRALASILVAMSIGLAGCLVASDNHVKREGTYIAESTFKQIEPGKTTSAWVLATIGSPSEKTSVDSKHEVWKYSYKETRDSHGAVFLLFAGSDRKVTDGTVFVELQDGVVSKCWRG